MKILKEPDGFKPFEQTCSHCQALLEVELKDLYQVVYMDPRDGYKYVGFTCGHCHKSNHVMNAVIPNNVKRNIPTL